MMTHQPQDHVDVIGDSVVFRDKDSSLWLGRILSTKVDVYVVGFRLWIIFAVKQRWRCHRITPSGVTRGSVSFPEIVSKDKGTDLTPNELTKHRNFAQRPLTSVGEQSRSPILIDFLVHSANRVDSAVDRFFRVPL